MKVLRLVSVLLLTLAGCTDPGEKSFGLVCTNEDGEPLDRYVVHPKDKAIEAVKPFGKGFKPGKNVTFAGSRIYASFGSDYTDEKGKPITITSEIDMDNLTLKWHTDYREGTTYYGGCEIRDLDASGWDKFNK